MTRDNQSSFGERLLSWIRESWIRYSKVCSKRNALVNVVLAIALAIAIVLSLTVLVGALALLFKVMNGDAVAIGTAWTFYPIFCILHMAGFLVGNRKKDILPGFIGSTFVWYIVLLFCNVMTMSNSDAYDDEFDLLLSEVAFITIPFAEALLLNVVYFGLIRAVMAIRKEGVAAWRLLEDGRRSKMEKMGIAVACLIWILPALTLLLPYFI